MRRGLIGCVLSVMIVSHLAGLEVVPKKQILDAARGFRKANEHSIIKQYFNLLSIPNVSSDRTNVRKNAEYIKQMFEKRGVKITIMETAGNPVIYGELFVPGATQTLMFYVHYDGQPVDPSKWIDHEPFTPVLRPGKMLSGTDRPKPIPFPPDGMKFEEDWRIYARSTSDDKAPLISIVTALDALKAANIPLKNNIKFIFEGEEEAGSINLGPFLKKHRESFESDVLFMCDGPAYYSGDPTLFFGVRGILGIEIKIYGPNTSLHSGHYGNWAPNPALRMAELLATMKDEDGKVLVDGFYDTVLPLTETEKKAVREVPNYEQTIKDNYGFIGLEGGGISLMEAIQLPSLNVNGLSSGWVGKQSRTIIPADATASIDIRLVKGCDPSYMVDRVKTHIRKQGYILVDEDPDQATRMKYPRLARITGEEGGYRAYRTPMDSPIARRVAEAFKDYYEKYPVFIPSLGGSLPIYLFDDILGIPVIGLSIANHDNNQHQPNENIRIGNLWNAIETYAAVLMMPSK
ncbi:M20/M25/M40 family metallo-hydrolase [Acidobacteriota bacterium]